MSISITDFIIIILIGLGGIVGYKNGVIKEGMHFIGIIVISIIAFMFKDTLMVLLYETLPFFQFFGPISGITAINILLYQLFAFIFIFAVLYFILRVFIVITGLVEWMLKFTVFFKLTSRILGIFVGILEFYVYMFLILFILNMPIFNLSYVNDSIVSNKILKNTPILSSLTDDTVYVYSDVWQIIRNRDKKTNTEVNTLVLATMLDHKLITVDSAKKIVESNKVIITDKTLLDKYEDDNKFYKYVKDVIATQKQ